MSTPYSINCPLCKAKITSRVNSTPSQDPDLDEVERLMLTLHVCKDRKVSNLVTAKEQIKELEDKLKPLASIEDVEGFMEKLKDAMLNYEDIRDHVLNDATYENETINHYLGVIDDIAAPFSEALLLPTKEPTND